MNAELSTPGTQERFPATRAQILLAKQARLERVLHLFHVEQISTFCIADKLGVSEAEICALLTEVDGGGGDDELVASGKAG